MIIDKPYVLERFGRLFLPRIEAAAQIEGQFEEIYRLKARFPVWMQRFFHPLNPLYFAYKRFCMLRRAMRLRRLQRSLPDTFSCDFVRYCLKHDSYRLDTADFAGPADETQLLAYVDNRLGSAVGAPLVAAAAPVEGFAAFRRHNIRARRDHWLLELDGKRYRLPVAPEAYGAFVHYGLDLLPEGVAGYLAGKDFVDCGAFVGDSAIYMLKYRPRKIYGFEPDRVNYDLLLKSIQLNALQEVVPLPRGLGDTPGTAGMTGQASSSRIAGQPQEAPHLQTIEISTLDEECRELNVGVIKMDIEGFEYPAVKGALETIRRDRPVLLISIYHTGKDFFEIVPMLKGLEVGYRFRWLDLAADDGRLTEKLLAAYPAELE